MKPKFKISKEKQHSDKRGQNNLDLKKESSLGSIQEPIFDEKV